MQRQKLEAESTLSDYVQTAFAISMVVTAPNLNN